MVSSSSSDGMGDLQCVGRLEIVSPKPVGFLCGTLPVPTDKAFNHALNTALIPSTSAAASSSSRETVRAPRYRMIPTETDLNTPPMLPNLHDQMFPVAAVHSRTTSGGDVHRETNSTSQNLARKSEALAVYGLSEYGDEIDVVAPADILKQIFKMPYSKARLSIAVKRIGQTLILNAGPDIEEGERLVRRHRNQSKNENQSLFLNFAMHSVRAEACDCPPAHCASSDEQPNSSILPGLSESRKSKFVSSDLPEEGDRTPCLHTSSGGSEKEELNPFSEYSEVKQDNNWGSKQSKRPGRNHAVKRTSQVDDKSKFPIESEKYRRVGSDGFLRILFWQFHNFRMLLGSDLLLFSNEKYVAVSLHLWDVARQVTPLTWLEAWLDNIMASVPELAICYHQDGVVQGYELLKTDDIFLLKGISEDGTPAFHPQVVQQNGLSVLRFLQANCKQDPGAYWLYKSAGEDVIQLFDLSVIPKNHSSADQDGGSSSLPSLMQRGRSDSLFSLGTLLYRLAHRLSLSLAPSSRAKCARFFRKCLDFLDEQDHLVVRAFAHEQFARLILNCHEELDLTSEFVPNESEVTVTDAEHDSSDITGSGSHSKLPSHAAQDDPWTDSGYVLQGSKPEETFAEMQPDTYIPSRIFVAPGDLESVEIKGDSPRSSSSDEDVLAVYNNMNEGSSHVIQTIADPVSSKLAAIHHVSQAIKSLRWKRQLQKSEVGMVDQGRKTQERFSPVNFLLCACGDADCIEVCDIREWISRSKMDSKLWKLVLLLGESYLALGQAYKEDGQLHQALKIVDIACSVYGSMPQHLDDAEFISSMPIRPSFESVVTDKIGRTRSTVGQITNYALSSSIDGITSKGLSSTFLFWANAWTLVGDVYVEYHILRGKEILTQKEPKSSTSELKISSDVVKEVKRLKKKLGHLKQNCATCSLINCSCQSDRANSGSSASSSSRDRPSDYGRKHSKRSNAKKSLHTVTRSRDVANSQNQMENAIDSENESSKTGSPDITDPGSNAAKAKIELTASNGSSGCMASTLASESEPNAREEAPKEKSGGIFKFIKDPIIGDAEDNLLASAFCYDAAVKALAGVPTSSMEFQSIIKKKGWVCNELGRNRLERKQLHKAELAFADAIKAFKEVSDHTNIILINCNLGHGRRAVAEEMISKMETLKPYAFFQNEYKQALETAMLEYRESLRYYGAARVELHADGESSGSATVSSSLRNDVYTQYANTYLRLGMLLAKEDISAEVYETGSLPIGSVNSCDNRTRKELRKHEISANDAIREALSMYESLGELRKQEAAYAYFQLGCYHRDCCLKFLDQVKLLRSESSIVQKAKQYASLAERSWQKSINFYGPKTHPAMYLNVLIERSALAHRLSESFHPTAMLEESLSRLFEGRHVFGEQTADATVNEQTEAYAKFRSQLQSLLKKMLQMALSGSTSKSSAQTISSGNNSSADIRKLRELYGMALKMTSLSQLITMYEFWSSS